MFIPTTDMASVSSGAVSSEAAKGSSHQSLASGSTNTSAGAFGQLLMQLSGQDGQQNLLTSEQSAIRLLMNSALPIVPAAGEEDLQQLLDWLNEAIQMLEGPEQQAILNMLEQDPETMQLLASMTMALLASTDANQPSLTAETRGSMLPAEAMAKLHDWLQHARGQLANSEPSSESLNGLRALQHVLEPLLNEAKGQAGNTLAQSGERTMQQAAGSQEHALARADVLARGAMMNAERTNQQQADMNFRQVAVQMSSSDVSTTATVHQTLMPRTDLLRPELLSLAMSETAEATATEGKASEAALTNPLLVNETAKGTAPLTAARIPTMQQVPVEQFVQEMNKFVFKSFQVNQLNGLSEARISLVPENLGQVDIKLTMQNGHLTATLVAETVMGREALEQQLGQLRAVLQGQGLQVDKLEVTTQANSTSTPFFRDQDHSQGSRQFEERSKSDSSKYEEDASDFVQELDYLQNEYETYVGVGGRSFHATA